AAYAETTLHESGRPTMIVPAGTRTCRLERCAVAWDGSATAARAVNDAIPLLAAFDAVELVCVRHATQLRDQLPGFEMTQHLVRHGIDAVLHEVPVRRDDTIETLLSYLGKACFDLVVMGAYSRTWVQERLFGGATRSLLASHPTTLFLSHS
ncbi:universal stress protein, partial [Beijerinckia sp. L45]|uniref:universal stress protein n=1 Tax=Beijerinckia sp. L45 TaxID=1641855 RepID=UPI001AED7B7A